MPDTRNSTPAGNANSRFSRYLKPAYVIPLFILLLLLGYFISRTFYDVNTFTYTRLTMDTVAELRFQARGARDAEEISDRVFDEIERLEKLFSRSVPESDISNINDNAGQKPVKVSPEVFFVIKEALEYAELSEGAFDPTVAPLTDLWGFFSDQDYRLPEPGEIEDTLQLVNYGLVELDQEEQTVYLPLPGMGLELGGIAKGFIVDQALEILQEEGVKNAYVNAGDIGLLGTRPDGDPWRIGVRNPRDEMDMIAVLPLENKAVDTSGDYERFFEEEGVKYHHILDARTGMPAEELASVTVVADTTMAADVLSTVAFILGPQQGFDLIEKKAGAEGIFVTPELEITYTAGLEDTIEIEQ